MKNLFLTLFICCGILSRAQDSINRPWNDIVENYGQYAPLLKRLSGETEKNILEEEKISTLKKNKTLIKKQLEKELIRRKDPATLYHVRGGYVDYDPSYQWYVENIIDSLLNTMIERDAEGRIKNKPPQTTFTFAAPCNNCMQSLSPAMFNDSITTIYEWKNPLPKKINQKTKEVPAKQRKITTFDFNEKITINLCCGIGEKIKSVSPRETTVITTQKALSEITTVAGFPIICGGTKTENLKNKLKGNWCNHFYKDEKGKEMWKLFPSAGLMSGCTGIGFFENDSCREYISGMISIFGRFSKQKTNFSVKDSVLTFTIKTNEGKTEFEHYKIIKVDETEILLERIADQIKTAVPFLLIEPDHCHWGMGEAGTKK
ncbi:MAG: hypothetical protein IAF38_20505 [Bacteroidia bacterium]|nr:hypothetical protein [Bacteroidia bacterium]